MTLRGILCDIIGRRWCFNITCLIASIFGLLFAAPSNYSALCFLVGLTVRPLSQTVD